MNENHGDIIYDIRHLKKEFRTSGSAQRYQHENPERRSGMHYWPFRFRKSTFLRCLNLLEIPTGGELYFEGSRIDMKTSAKKLRRDVGSLVF